MMDVVFAISGHRGISEVEVLNQYTIRQATALCEHVVRVKLLSLSEFSRALSGKAGPKTAPSKAGDEKKTPASPSWKNYARRSRSRNVSIIDLDGPMEAIRPFLGKKTLNRTVFTSRERKKRRR